MKTKDLIFTIFSCLTFLMMSCSEFEMTDNYLDNAQLKKASTVPVFVVEPCGGDDTPAIMQAFMDAKAAGTGSVVQLLEGEYHLGLIEIRDFHGSFRGAGKDKTIITAMNNLDAQALIDQGQYPQLVKFVGGDIHVCNFTLRTPEGAISNLLVEIVEGGEIIDHAEGHIQCLMNFSAYNAIYELGDETRSINAVVDNVSFRGQFYDVGQGFYKYKYNCLYAVRTGWDCIGVSDLPRENINFKITNSDFNTFCYGLVLEAMKNGELIVGEKNNGNIFNVCEQGGGVWESRGMKITIEGNTFNVPIYCWGFDISDYPFYGILANEPETKITTCNIYGNVFNLTTADYGLYFRNQRHFLYPGEKPMAIQVKNNLFKMTDGYPWSIYTQVTKDMVIRNNKFSGYGYDAIILTLYSEGGLVLGNNFSTAEFTRSSLYLDGTTQGWTVVGGNVVDNLINLGVDNIITGFNVSNSDVPLGPRISDKLKTMNRLVH